MGLLPAHDDWRDTRLTTTHGIYHIPEELPRLSRVEIPGPSFLILQGSLRVLTVTQYAIDLCKTLAVEVTDLSSEVQRLVFYQGMRKKYFSD